MKNKRLVVSCLLAFLLVSSFISSALAAGTGSLYFFSTHYADKGSFVRLNMENMSIDPLGIVGDNPTVSPSGRYLGYEKRFLHIYDLQAKSVLEVPTLRGGNQILISDTEVAYIHEMRSSERGLVKGHENDDEVIGLLSLNTMQERILSHRLPDSATHSNLAFVPGTGGDTLSFVIASRERRSRENPSEKNVLYIVTPHATKEIFVSPTLIRYPTVSPDGKKVAFVRDSYNGLWVINIDGSNLTQINDSQDCGYPTWSPDGQYIAFYSVNSATRGTLYQDAYNSSNTQRGAGGFTYRLWMMRSDGSDVQPLQTADGNGISIYGRAIWR